MIRTGLLSVSAAALLAAALVLPAADAVARNGRDQGQRQGTVLAIDPITNQPRTQPPRCSEGRTRTGECINAVVAAQGRCFAIIDTQAKHSHSVSLLPAACGGPVQARKPLDYHWYLRGPGSTAPFPYSCHPFCF